MRQREVRSLAYGIQVVADSMSPAGVRLTTLCVTMPRFILAEFNTHRVFSRNSASTRAIPLDKQIERVAKDPFIPEYWGMNRSGMQADEEIPEELRATARTRWLLAMQTQIDTARMLSAIGEDEDGKTIGVHKQTAGRLLEPFMWQTVVVTATEWSNFLALRANPQAQPEMRIVAEMIEEALRDHQPRQLEYMEWHLPFLQEDERDGGMELSVMARRICAARCARVSYLTHAGKRSYVDDLALYERLVKSGHMSPLEHVATPKAHTKFYGNFRGWKQLRKSIKHEDDFAKLEALREEDLGTGAS